MASGGWVTTLEDVTEKLHAIDELHKTREFLNAVIENVPTAIAVRSISDSRYILVNKACENYFGMPRDRVLGRNPSELFGKKIGDRVMERDDQMLVDGGAVVLYDVTPTHDGPNDPRVVNNRRLIVRGRDGKPAFFLAVVEDVTEQKRAKERIAYLAHHDMLTGLANRAAFEEKFDAALEVAGRNGETLGVMCTDLDRFKEVNDLFGHSVGDELLRQVSARLRAVTGPDIFIARLGGDEFTILMPGEGSPDVLQSLADRLSASIAEPFEIDGKSVRVGLTVGVAVFPTDGADGAGAAWQCRCRVVPRQGRRPRLRALLRCRDGSPSQGPARAAVGPAARDRAAASSRCTISRRRLISGEVFGFEALIRWTASGAAGIFRPTRSSRSPRKPG